MKFWSCTKDTLRVFCKISTEPFRPPGHNHSAKHARNGKWLRLRATPSGEGLSSSTDIELVSYVVKKLVVKKVNPTGKEAFPIWHRCTMNGGCGCSIAIFHDFPKLRGETWWCDNLQISQNGIPVKGCHSRAESKTLLYNTSSKNRQNLKFGG